jgi:HEAT repeat protein
VRLQATEALGELRDARACLAIIANLRDRDEGIRKLSIRALKNIGDLSAIPPLIDRLKDDSSSVRGEAVSALTDFSVAAIPFLTKALSSSDMNFEYEIIKCLKAIGKPVVESLLAMLDDPNSFSRASAIAALTEMDDSRVIPSLIRALKDSAPDVRRRAASALGNKKDDTALFPLIESLADEHEGVRTAAAHALGALQRAEAVDGLIQALLKSSRDTGSYFDSALVKIGKPAVETLIMAFENKENDGHARYRMVMALGQIGDTRALAPLINALREGCQDELRFGIISALKFIGGAEAEVAIKSYG